MEKGTCISSVEIVLKPQEHLGKTWNLGKGKPWEKKKKTQFRSLERTCWLLQNRRQEGKWEESTQSKVRCTLPDRHPPKTEVSSMTNIGYKARNKGNQGERKGKAEEKASQEGE